jgi:hypothetical protein
MREEEWGVGRVRSEEGKEFSVDRAAEPGVG